MHPDGGEHQKVLRKVRRYFEAEVEMKLKMKGDGWDWRWDE